MSYHKTIYKLHLFRMKQLLRIGTDLTIPLALVLVSIALYAINLILSKAAIIHFVLPPLLISLCLLFIHKSRNDNSFLKKLNCSPELIYLSEYLSISLFFSTFCLFHSHFISALFILISPLPIVFLSTRKQGDLKERIHITWVNRLPLQLFEIKSGLRKSPTLYLLLTVIGILFSNTKGVAIAFALFQTLFATGFYFYYEPKEILEIQMNKSHFLLNKIFSNIVANWTLILPLCGLNLFYFPELWYWSAIVLLISSLLISFNLVYKYATYHPHNTQVHNTVPLSLYFISILIPFMLPVALIQLLSYSIKAKKNLQSFYVYN